MINSNIFKTSFINCLLAVRLRQPELEIESIRSDLFTHRGSVWLQEELDLDALLLPSITLLAVTENFEAACTDTYGNYVIQKLIPLLSNNQLCQVIKLTWESFVRIAECVSGACVLGKLIEEISKRNMESFLVPLIDMVTAELLKSQYGCHVLQSALEHFSSHHLDHLLSHINSNFIEIATDKYGCCLIKKVIEYHGGFVFDSILENVHSLCMVSAGRAIVSFYPFTEPIWKLCYSTLL